MEREPGIDLVGRFDCVGFSFVSGPIGWSAAAAVPKWSLSRRLQTISRILFLSPFFCAVHLLDNIMPGQIWWFGNGQAVWLRVYPSWHTRQPEPWKMCSTSPWHNHSLRRVKNKPTVVFSSLPTLLNVSGSFHIEEMLPRCLPKERVE